MPGNVLVSYTITLPPNEASQKDQVMQELRSQTPSSLDSELVNEVGKLSNGTKYHMKVLAVEPPTATAVRTTATTKSAAAHIWKPLASTLLLIFALLV